MEPKRVSELIFKYLRNELSFEEGVELETWKNARQENKKLFEKLTDPKYINTKLKEIFASKDRVLKKVENKITMDAIAGMEGSDAERMVYLIAGYLGKTLTTEEHDELDRWVESSDRNMEIFEELTDEKNPETLLTLETKFGTNTRRPTSVRGRYRNLGRWAIAASVLAVVIAVVFEATQKKVSSVTEKPLVAMKKDFEPGGNHAMLKLSDGTTILLDSTAIGKLNIKNENIEKQDSGSLAYQNQPAGESNGALNTISTPRGGQYSIMLSDGTRVWLNAASSLSYPVIFPKTGRKVELTGEGYFEVSKNAKAPFVVKVNGMEVEVTGTHFNIHAYGDEHMKTVTLLEGSVNVVQNEGRRTLRPGEAAIVSNEGQISVKSNIDTLQAIAWKMGLFHFEHTAIPDIMNQISRWYDVDIAYENNFQDKTFSGKISRNVHASEVLDMLQYAGVHFRIENKKIIVMK
jgi:transmembrane sensor